MVGVKSTASIGVREGRRDDDECEMRGERRQRRQHRALTTHALPAATGTRSTRTRPSEHRTEPAARRTCKTRCRAENAADRHEDTRGPSTDLNTLANSLGSYASRALACRNANMRCRHRSRHNTRHRTRHRRHRSRNRTRHRTRHNNTHSIIERTRQGSRYSTRHRTSTCRGCGVRRDARDVTAVPQISTPSACTLYLQLGH
jgi:hypothetical protein